MIPYLVFGYEEGELYKGGMNDLFLQLVFTDDRTALENWKAEVQTKIIVENREETDFVLIRINPSSFVELDTYYA